MAAPNLLVATTCTGRSAGGTIQTTATTMVSNGVASSQVVKVNTVMVTNSGTSAISVTLDLYKNGPAYYISYAVAVPANSTLVLLAKDSPVYLEEGDALRTTASTTGLYYVTSYEVIS